MSYFRFCPISSEHTAVILLLNRMSVTENSSPLRSKLLLSRFTASKPRMIAPDAHAYLMEVMHGVRQPTEISPCGRANCSQLCLLRSHGYTCACDALFSLASDNKTCVESEIHGNTETLIADVCQPPCKNGRTCVIRKDRYFCACPRGSSGENCEIQLGRKSSVLTIVLATLSILAVIGTSIIAVLYLRGSLNM